jgi:hypothetical protein
MTTWLNLADTWLTLGRLAIIIVSGEPDDNRALARLIGGNQNRPV